MPGVAIDDLSDTWTILADPNFHNTGSFSLFGCYSMLDFCKTSQKKSDNKKGHMVL